MTRKLKRISMYASLAVVVLGAPTAMLTTRAARMNQVENSDSIQAMDAAFRDGLYLGKLDAQQGRKQHLSIGRWNSAKDRASFTTGYLQGYRQVLDMKIVQHAN
jgi:hypothetical protein